MKTGSVGDQSEFDKSLIAATPEPKQVTVDEE